MQIVEIKKLPLPLSLLCLFGAATEAVAAAVVVATGKWHWSARGHKCGCCKDVNVDEHAREEARAGGGKVEVALCMFIFLSCLCFFPQRNALLVSCHIRERERWEAADKWHLALVATAAIVAVAVIIVVSFVVVVAPVFAAVLAQCSLSCEQGTTMCSRCNCQCCMPHTHAHTPNLWQQYVPQLG